MDREDDERINRARDSWMLRVIVIAAIVILVLLAIWGGMAWYATNEYATSGYSAR